MSGILALLQEDGSPVDSSLVEELTGSMAFRGPDKLEVKVIGDCGLGHAMLQTTVEAGRETQPTSLDGKVWICADARIDGRDHLRSQLASEERGGLATATDPELILHAWRVWGVDCLSRLIGDFAFVVWDAMNGRLVCARDHFGVKPLYYARLGRSLIVSNTFETLRRHPQATNSLNELWIADSLLFDNHQDPAKTAYTDIRRLPAAHCLVWHRGELSMARYWTLPSSETLRYKNEKDYTEHFNEVFGVAVRDRLRTDRVAINMSGGLDSTTVAATARRVTREAGDDCRLKAFTGVYEAHGPDPERAWAAMAADFLGIPIHFTVGGAVTDYDPLDNPMGRDHSRALAGEARVALTGFGGDPMNRGSSGCYLDLLKRGEIGQLLVDVREVLRAGKRPPLLLRTLWRHWRSRRKALRSYPDWIDRDFEVRLDLRSRWRQTCLQIPIGWSARAEIVLPFWADLFESFDPGSSRLLVEHRHPFFDLRVVDFMLRVPPLPWYMQKLLLRRAMRGELPDALLARPKETFAGDSEETLLAAKGRGWWKDKLEVSPAIRSFVDIDRFLDALDRHFREGTHDLDELIRPIALAQWLRVNAGPFESG